MHHLVRSTLILIWPLLTFLVSFWPFSLLKDYYARNLRKPDNNILASYIMSKLFESINRENELLAVEKCDIQGSDQVLEVGFGPGLGLDFAVGYLRKAEKGKLYGIDYSQSMVEVASKRMKAQIEDQLVELHHASVAKLPFDDHKFDKVFHSNVFYFWDDQVGCCAELLRVLKPGGLMIAALDLKAVHSAASMGLLNEENADVDNFMISLQNAGFIDVSMKEYPRLGNVVYGCVYARKAKK